MKKYSKLFGYLISLIFLFITFRGTDIHVIVENVKLINMWYIAFALLLHTIFYIIRGYYQKNNLSPFSKNISISNSILSISIAYFFNVIFPARFGEILRTYFLSKNECINKTSIFSYICIEKIIDLFVITIFFMFIVFSNFNDGSLNNLFLGLVCILMVCLTLISFYMYSNTKFLNTIKRLVPIRFFTFFSNLNDQILEGIRCFKSPQQIGRSFILLFMSWFVMLGVFWLISRQYVILLDLPNYACIFFMVFSALSVSVPSAPAGIGVMHYGLFLAIKLLNPETVISHPNLVAACIIVMHFVIILSDFIVGGGIMVLFTLKRKRFFITKDILNKKM